MGRRIFVQSRIAGLAHVVVKAVRKAVVELFKKRLERSIFCGNLAFFQFKVEKVSAHAVLDIGQVAFKHAGREVVALRDFHRQALVVPELTRISKRSVCLLVQNGTRL